MGESRLSWKWLDVAGCIISFVIGWPAFWRHPELQYWTGLLSVMKNGRQRRISTKETNSKKALKIAEEFERAVKTKRTLEQVQQALDRLHEEVSGQNVNRTHLFESI